MNRADREQLIRLARGRARLAKSKAAEREKILMSEAEDLLAAEYSARDQLWAEATAIAEEACRKANEQIAAQSALLGIPQRMAPRLQLSWDSRGQGQDSGRRAELRKVAQSRLAALTAMAKTAIDEQLLDTEQALIADSLESAEAVAFLERMPTAEQLMPSLSLDDLGVKHWQPHGGAAGELLTPSTPADRRRRAILRAIEANPGASDRKVAEIAGCDHKTVAQYRRAGGELPAPPGEFPGGEDGPNADGTGS